MWSRKSGAFSCYSFYRLRPIALFGTQVSAGKNHEEKFRKKYNEQLNEPFVLHTADLREKDGVILA